MAEQEWVLASLTKFDFEAWMYENGYDISMTDEDMEDVADRVSSVLGDCNFLGEVIDTVMEEFVDERQQDFDRGGRGR